MFTLWIGFYHIYHALSHYLCNLEMNKSPFDVATYHIHFKYWDSGNICVNIEYNLICVNVKFNLI